MSSQPPTPSDFQEPLKQALCVLLQRKQEGTEWVSASQVASGLVKEHGLAAHWKTIETLLTENPHLAAKRKRKNRREFKILTAGEQEVSKGENPIIFVNPTKAVQSVVTLHDFFAEFKGSVKICDPYFDIVTLQHLEAFSSATAIRLLTSSISDTPTLRTALTAFASQKQIEVRKPVGDVLHDRYIIESNSMLITGTSLNSFGKKQSFVIKTGQDIRSVVLANFDQLWAAAKPWP
jgi:hypothetical protein